MEFPFGSPSKGFGSNPDFELTHKLVHRGATGIGFIILVRSLFDIALVCTVAYVAWHFIAKFW